MQNKTRFLLPVFALILIVLSIVLYIYIPHFIRRELAKTLPLLNTSESRTFATWKVIPYHITNSIYLYNVTNTEAVKLGQVPILEQLGPFVFKEKRVKDNISWLPAANTSDNYSTIEYEQFKQWHFVPEESNGTLNDVIRHLNVPIITAGKIVKESGGGWLEYFELNGLIYTTGSVLFPKHTVDELLFTGYTDAFIKRMHGLHKMSFDKFGWFYNKNNSADGVYQIFSGTSDLKKMGEMYAWNRSRELSLWYGDSCNSLDNVFHGDLFPPFEEHSLHSIKLFAAELCRPLKLYFEGKQYLNGVEANRYMINEYTFNYTLQENQCFCPKSGCPADGLTDVGPCLFDAPLGASLPHFLYSDPVYNSAIRGIQMPDPHNHSFFMDIEPTLGIPIRFALRMQMNVFLEKNEHLNFAKHLNESIYYPQMWFSVFAEMDEEMSKQLYLVQKLPFYINIAASVIALIAVIILVIWILLEIRRLRKKEETASYVTLDEDGVQNVES